MKAPLTLIYFYGIFFYLSHNFEFSGKPTIFAESALVCNINI